MGGASRGRTGRGKPRRIGGRVDGRREARATEATGRGANGGGAGREPPTQGANEGNAVTTPVRPEAHRWEGWVHWMIPWLPYGAVGSPGGDGGGAAAGIIQIRIAGITTSAWIGERCGVTQEQRGDGPKKTAEDINGASGHQEEGGGRGRGWVTGSGGGVRELEGRRGDQGRGGGGTRQGSESLVPSCPVMRPPPPPWGGDPAPSPGTPPPAPAHSTAGGGRWPSSG